MTYLKIILLFMSCTACSCQNFGQTRPSQYDQRQQQPQKPQAFYSGYNQNERVSKGVMELAINIAKQSMKKNSKNEIFSPISIAGALSLLLLGANKSTYDQLVNVLNLQGMQSIDIHTQFGKLIQDLTTNQISSQWPPTNWKIMDTCNEQDDEPSENNTPKEPMLHNISIANGIFVQNGYKLIKEYVNAANEIYEGEVKNLDFAREPQKATKYINDWVNFKTVGKIPEIISGGLSHDTRMIITSALYFKADWLESFIDEGTMERDFFPDGKGNPPIKTELMAHGGCFPFYSDVDKDIRIMGFPYKENLTTMYIILPNNSSRSVLQNLQQNLKADDIENMISKMQMKTSIILFPKMHATNTISLKKTLRDLGLYSLFKPDKSDLSLIANADDNNEDFHEQFRKTQKERERVEKIQQGDHTVGLAFRLGGANATDSKNVAPSKKVKRDVKYKVETPDKNKKHQLNMKDFLLRKKIYKQNPDKKSHRSRREAQDSLFALNTLREMNENLKNLGLFAENIVHKVDLDINEVGTEGGAATAITLNRSGSSVVFRVDTPFLILIRHDPTKVPLFYGNIYDPSPDKLAI